MDAYIYYGQYTGKGPISRYIQLFTWSKRSHTSAFLPPDGNMIFDRVIESWKWGVCESHWWENHRPGTVIDVYRVPCSQEQADRFYAGLRRELGKKYDYLGVISFRLRKCLQSPDRWFCSELIFQKALDVGVTLLADVESWRVTPAMMDFVPTKQWIKRLVTQKER